MNRNVTRAADASGRTRRTAFTLVEVVMALGIMTVLLGAVCSALYISLKAVPDESDPVEAVVQGGSAVEQITGELHTAVWVNSQSSTAISVIVPDRDNDGNDDTIAYAWSGTPGDPVTRQYNGGAAVDFISDVHEFDLTYDMTTNSETRSGENESAETLLISHDASWNLSSVTVTANKWPGQFFLPTLAPEATAWSVTRFKIQTARAGMVYDGLATVEVRRATPGSLPGNTVLESFTLAEADLGFSYSWQEFYVSNASGLSPSQGLCLVVRPQYGAYPCKIRHHSGGGDGSHSFSVGSMDGGSSWWTFDTESMLYYVWGTVTTTGTQVVNVPYLTGVNIALRTGGEASSRVETAVQLLNQPEVAGL